MLKITSKPAVSHNVLYYQQLSIIARYKVSLSAIFSTYQVPIAFKGTLQNCFFAKAVVGSMNTLCNPPHKLTSRSLRLVSYLGHEKIVKTRLHILHDMDLKKMN